MVRNIAAEPLALDEGAADGMRVAHEHISRWPGFYRSVERHDLVDLGAAASDLECLSCAKPSPTAWNVLRNALHAAMTVSDTEARAEQERLLVLGIDAGPAAGVGLAGLRAACQSAETRGLAHLGPDSVVLVIGTEGRA